MRKIYLISSREPNGATWLINCFLELNIRTYRNSSPDMWCQGDRGHVLASHEEHLKKWLPSLWKNQYFNFRDDIEVQWSHEWPTEMHDQHQVIYFVRDPRDSLYSRYKRESPNQSFEEFINFPDINTMLNKIDNWCLFNIAWLQHPDHKVIRFEDYKQDAKQVLLETLDFIGLDYPAKDTDQAINASTYEKAAEAESSYRAACPEDNEIINRSGKAGEWRQGAVSNNVISNIEQVCGSVMQHFGYLDNGSDISANYSQLVDGVPFLQRIKLPEIVKKNNSGRNLVAEAIKFAETINRDVLVKARLRPNEVQCLLDSLQSLMQNLSPDSVRTYTDIRKEFLPATRRIAGKSFLNSLKKSGLYSWARRIYRGTGTWLIKI